MIIRKIIILLFLLNTAFAALVIPPNGNIFDNEAQLLVSRFQPGESINWSTLRVFAINPDAAAAPDPLGPEQVFTGREGTLEEYIVAHGHTMPPTIAFTFQLDETHDINEVDPDEVILWTILLFNRILPNLQAGIEHDFFERDETNNNAIIYQQIPTLDDEQREVMDEMPLEYYRFRSVLPSAPPAEAEGQFEIAVDDPPPSYEEAMRQDGPRPAALDVVPQAPIGAIRTVTLGPNLGGRTRCSSRRGYSGFWNRRRS